MFSMNLIQKLLPHVFVGQMLTDEALSFCDDNWMSCFFLSCSGCEGMNSTPVAEVSEIVGIYDSNSMFLGPS